MGSILLVCLLLAFLGKDTHPFSASHHQYTLDFKKWCQKNDKYTTERPVRRRPAEFVSKQNMAEIAAQRWLYYNVVMFESTRWGGRGVYFKKQNFKGMTKRLLLRGDYSTVLWCLKAKCVEGGILLRAKLWRYDRDYCSEVITLQCYDVWKHSVGERHSFKEQNLRYDKEIIVQRWLQCCDV